MIINPNLSPKLTLFTARRSIRRYQTKAIAKPIIEQLLRAASWAPSAHNRQPARFAVLTKMEDKIRLASAMGKKLQLDLTADQLDPALIEKDVARSYSRITKAPTLILVALSMNDMDHYPDPVRQQNEYLMAVQSCAMAGQNLLLAATKFELAACWMCAPLFCPELVKTTLHLPSDWQPQGLITMGYPAETKEKTRHPLSEIALFL